MSVNAVLFDFGMVLSGPPHAPTWAAMQFETGLDESTFHRAYWSHRDNYDAGALSGREYWSQVGEEAGRPFSEQQINTLLNLDLGLWTEMNEPMLTWLFALHRAGISTGILSNMGDSMAEGICRKFDWVGRFHHTVWSHALRMRKPDPAIYRAAAEGLATPADQILFLDDKLENIEAAQAFGMQALLYSTHDRFEQEMRRRGLGYLLDVATVTSLP